MGAGDGYKAYGRLLPEKEMNCFLFSFLSLLLVSNFLFFFHFLALKPKLYIINNVLIVLQTDVI